MYNVRFSLRLTLSQRKRRLRRVAIAGKRGSKSTEEFRPHLRGSAKKRKQMKTYWEENASPMKKKRRAGHARSPEKARERARRRALLLATPIKAKMRARYDASRSAERRRSRSSYWRGESEELNSRSSGGQDSSGGSSWRERKLAQMKDYQKRRPAGSTYLR